MAELKHNRPIRDEIRCSFCAKAQRPGVKLIAGPGTVFICAECVYICHSILLGEYVEQLEEAFRQNNLTMIEHLLGKLVAPWPEEQERFLGWLDRLVELRRHMDDPPIRPKEEAPLEPPRPWWKRRRRL